MFTIDYKYEILDYQIYIKFFVTVPIIVWELWVAF